MLMKLTVHPYPMEAMGGWTIIRPEPPRVLTFLERLANMTLILMDIEQHLLAYPCTGK